MKHEYYIPGLHAYIEQYIVFKKDSWKIHGNIQYDFFIYLVIRKAKFFRL